LTLNEEKTRTCDAWQESFNFLGYTFGVRYAFGSGRKYLGASPSSKSLARLRDKVRELTGPETTWLHEEILVGAINRLVRGWTSYFSYGSLWRAYVKMERFLAERVRGWLVRKHKLGTRGQRRYPAEYLYGPMGLVHLPTALKGMRTP